MNRLVTEQAPDKTLNYQYDSYGNRSQLSVTGDEAYTTSYTYDKNNRLRKQTKAAGSASEITDFWYDPNGNQISSMTITTGGTGTAGIGIQPAGQSMNSYSEYNSWNQLISTMQNGKTASYAYNDDGLRMSKTVDGVKTSHIWDGTNIVGDVTNGTVTKYMRGLQLISSKTGSNESFYTYNGHGDVVQLTGGNGSITKQYSYDAFGVEKDKAETDTNPFRYCGEYYDTETDSIYLRARYYTPVTGRFTTEDTYWLKYKVNNREEEKSDLDAIAQTINLYLYCVNNPISKIDPLGLYDRNAAVNYAMKYGFSQNEDNYEVMRRGDCANFVSQCLIAGGIAMKNSWHYYKRFLKSDYTSSWSVAEEQYKYFNNPYRGYRQEDVGEETIQLWSTEGIARNKDKLQVGDLIYFADRTTRVVSHAAIITDIGAGNEIYYAAHSRPNIHEPLSNHFDENMVFVVRIRDDAVNGYCDD